jgi:hypothetical protein
MEYNMSVLVSSTTKYSFKPAEIKKLIATDLKEKEENIELRFVLQDTADDRFSQSSSYEVTSVEVTINHKTKS